MGIYLVHAFQRHYLYKCRSSCGQVRSSQLFFENIKKYTDFGKKCPFYVHLWAKLSFKMHFYKNISEKKHPFISSFCMSCMKRLSKCPYSKKRLLPRKSPGCRLLYYIFVCFIPFIFVALTFISLGLVLFSIDCLISQQ